MIKASGNFQMLFLPQSFQKFKGKGKNKPYEKSTVQSAFTVNIIDIYEKHEQKILSKSFKPNLIVKTIKVKPSFQFVDKRGSE